MITGKTGRPSHNALQINYFMNRRLSPDLLVDSGVHCLGRVLRCKVQSSFSKSVSNFNRTEWSPNRSVIIRVIAKSDDRAAGVRFVYHEYEYRLNSMTRGLITN